MKSHILLFAAMIALAGCSDKSGSDNGQVSVTEAAVRLPAVNGRPAAAYFTIQGGKKSDRLESVSSDKAASIELHENVMMNGMMTMQPMTGVDVPAKGSVAFHEGGSHAMIFGLDPAVQPDSTLKLRFTFQSGKTIEVDAETLAAGDDMPDMQGHDGQ